MIEINWLKVKCPMCGQEYEYPENGYKPKTCSKFECTYKYLHPEIYNLASRKQLDDKESMRR